MRRDLRIAEIAGCQHGLVTRHQLIEIGCNEQNLAARLARGSLFRVYAGVFRVGHVAPTLEAKYLGAVLACGDGALLSGPPAGYHLHLMRWGSPPEPEVTAPGEHDIPGLVVHRARRVAREGMVWREIPVTTVPETLVELAATLRRKDLGRACHQADVLHEVTPDEIQMVLRRRPNARGIGTLKALIRDDGEILLSRLEAGVHARIRGLRLPLPLTNRPAGGRRIDLRWPEHRVTVELDGYRYHRTRHAWESDRAREREARMRGDEFRRFTWEDVAVSTRYLDRELLALLSP